MNTEMLSQGVQSQKAVDGVFTEHEQTDLDREMSEAEQTRQEYLPTETSLKSTGQAYGWVGFVATLFGVLSLVTGFGLPMAEAATAIFVRATFGTIGVYLFVLGLLIRATGIRLEKLEQGAYRLAWITAIISIPMFPLGTAIGGWLVWLLMQPGTKFVLGREYQRVLAFTK